MSTDPPADLSELDPAAQGALLRQLIGGALDAMVTIDDRGRVLEFNPAAESLFGYRRDKVLGRLLNELILPPEHREAHVAGLARYLETRRSKILGRRLELEALRADASRIPIELTVLPTRVGARTYFTAFLRDLSERKAREQELQRARDAAESSLAAQSAFLASMSHELRTPLTAIIGYADLLKRGLDRQPSERETWLGHVLRNADHLLTLLNDLLDLSKLEANELTLESAELNPVDLIKDVVGLTAPLAAKEGLEFSWECAPYLPRRIYADPLRLKQVLLNLLTNAIKYTPAGLVRLTAEPTSDGTGLLIAVEDTGIGIPAARLPTIFEPFKQAHGASAGRHKGTGLGLSIASRLTELLAGELSVRSEVGQGTTFTLRLPCEPADLVGLDELLGVQREPARSEALPRLAFAGVSVLVADDHPQIRGLLRILLEEQGALVSEAEDGQAALEAIEAAHAAGTPFRVALFDMEMPRLGGADAVRRLRASGDSLPVIALTAHAMRGDREACLAAGCDGYVSKPVSPRQLLAQLAEVLDLRAGPRLPAEPGETPARPPQVIQLDPRLVKLALEFREGLSPRLEALDRALAREDLHEVRRIAHTISGTAGSYGFAELGDQARNLDQALRSGLDLSQLKLPVQALRGALEQALEARVEGRG